MIRRLVLAVVAAPLFSAPAAAWAVDAPPTVGAPTFTPTSSASVGVSVSIDTHDTATTVKVEYVTVGAYRTDRNPGPATLVTIATVPASDAGPAVVTGTVPGLEPGSGYTMRVRAVNAGGETLSTGVNVSTPRAPRIAFTAKVGQDTTKLTKLTVTGLVGQGAESVRLTCRTRAKGCPFTSQTDGDLQDSTVKLTALVKGHALKPGAKLAVQVLAAGSKVAAVTLTIRDDQQPKVRRS